jgi:hypothetical protein
MTPSRRAVKIVTRLCGVLLVGSLAAACSPGNSASPPPVTGVPSGGHASTTTTTTTTTVPETLPACGASRDPLDPTNSRPPSGSPANC